MNGNAITVAEFNQLVQQQREWTAQNSRRLKVLQALQCHCYGAPALLVAQTAGLRLEDTFEQLLTLRAERAADFRIHHHRDGGSKRHERLWFPTI